MNYYDPKLLIYFLITIIVILIITMIILSFTKNNEFENTKKDMLKKLLRQSLR